MTKLEMLKNKTIYTFSFKMKDILQDVSEINGNMRMSVEIDGKTLPIGELIVPISQELHIHIIEGNIKK